jgi:hypothetical protein
VLALAVISEDSDDDDMQGMEREEWRVSVEGTQIMCTKEATAVQPFAAVRLLALGKGGKEFVTPRGKTLVRPL